MLYHVLFLNQVVEKSFFFVHIAQFIVLYTFPDNLRLILYNIIDILTYVLLKTYRLQAIIIS